MWFYRLSHDPQHPKIARTSFMHISLTEGIIWYVCFLFSTTCHEAAHALAAKWGGDDTAYDAGQVTLNPIPHIRREPFGTVLVPIISLVLNGGMMGWASAPYDPDWQERYPRRAAWMALAGPAANFAILLTAAILIKSFIAWGTLADPGEYMLSQVAVAADTGQESGLSVFLSILFSLNLLLFTLNLMPLPPLDGATIIGLLVDEKTALKIFEATRNPTLQIVGLMILFSVFREIFSPVFLLALRLMYGF